MGGGPEDVRSAVPRQRDHRLGLSQWPDVHCIDYLVYVDAATAEGRSSVEGVEPPNQVLSFSGDGVRDGRVIGELMGRILRVTRPV